MNIQNLCKALFQKLGPPGFGNFHFVKVKVRHWQPNYFYFPADAKSNIRPVVEGQLPDFTPLKSEHSPHLRHIHLLIYSL